MKHQDTLNLGELDLEDWRTTSRHIEKMLICGCKFHMNMEISWEDPQTEVSIIIDDEGKPHPHIRKAKNGSEVCEINPNAKEEIQRIFSEYRNRHRWKVYMPRGQLSFKGNTKEAFKNFVDASEKLRCEVLVMPPGKFYSILAEFQRIPNEVHYYPWKVILSDDPLNSITEGWKRRIETIMSWVADCIFDNAAIANVNKLVEDLGKHGISVRSTLFNSKNWYCVAAIKKIADKQGWSIPELLERIDIYMSRKKTKRTPEMLLSDMIMLSDFIMLTKKNGVEKKLRGRKRHEQRDAIQDQEWYSEWKKSLPKET